MLYAVVDYARSRGLTAEPGFKPKTVRWLLIFSPKGEFQGLHDYEDRDQRIKGREFPKCPDLTQPEMVAAGEGCRPFLVDGLDVLLNWCKTEDDETAAAKLAAKHAYSLKWMHEATGIPELKVIAEKLNDLATCTEILEQLQAHKAKPTDLGTIAIQSADNLRILVTEDIWHDWWRGVRQQLGSARHSKSTGKSKKGVDAAMRCLLSGELISPLPTHGKISGLSGVGGLAMGDAVSSFDKDAFCSYGLEQGANAAMSEEMATTYVATLNKLIKEKSVQLAGTKVLYWYSHELPPEDDIVEDVFDFGDAAVTGDETAATGPSARDIGQAESRAKKLLEAIRSGERPDLKSARFFAVTLSANSGRVMIRDWMEGQFEDLAESIVAWFEDLEIIRRDGSSILKSQKFAAVLAAPVRDLKDVPAPLVSALWRCVLKGLAIPVTIAAQTLRRVTLDVMTDKPALHARLALLKAFLNRSSKVRKMTADLNPHETDPAYLCGRVMALLGKIQYEALGDVGAGIVQRYYAAASATPALVLGRLVRLAQTAHLPKMNSQDKKGLRVWFENQLAECWNAMPSPPPTVLSLEQQTLFAMGYYHQLAQRGKAKSVADIPAATAE